MHVDSRRIGRLAPLILFVALAVLPFVAYGLGATFYVSLVARFLIFAIAALALNLAMGYGGMISFGHALFLGLGAYGVAICSLYGIDSALLQLLVGLGIAVAAAVVIGAISLRTTSGLAFIMITLAFAQMGYFIFVSLPQFGGDDGKAVAHTAHIAGLDLHSPAVLYGVSFVLLLAFTIWLARIRKAPFGMVLRGTVQNRPRIASLGYPVFRYLLAAWVISAAMTALAGFLLANLTAYVSPATMAWSVSGELIVMAVFGGVGTVYGPVYGALAFLVLEYLLKGVTPHWAAYLGIIIVLVAVFTHRGLAGLLGERADHAGQASADKREPERSST